MKKSKLIVIGLDGATFELIKPWIKEDKLPTLKKLIKNGVSGKLKSTIPPLTSPAWPSFYTGKNPGKTGVFSFLKKKDNRYEFSPINSKSYNGERLWGYLSKHEFKVSIINAPITFPPEKVNGFMVSGMVGSTEGTYTYPEDIKEKINQIVKNYEIDFYGFHHTRIGKFLEMLYDRTEKRKKVILNLLKERDWDFALIVFTGPDRIQHYLWDRFDKSHPLYERNEFENSILEYWIYLDHILGEILSEMDENMNVFIMSDHGFRGMEGRFNINDWLRKEGYLKLKQGLSENKENVLIKLGLTGERIKSLIWKLNLQKFRKRLPKSLDRKLKHDIFVRKGVIEFNEKKVDWKKTKAYSFAGYTGNLYINKRLKEKEGIVNQKECEKLREEIIDKMKSIKNPITGEKLKIDFFKPEDIYKGEYVNKAPDLFVCIEDFKYIMQSSLGHKNIISPLTKEKPSNATHTMYGIFIAHGPDIKHGIEIKNTEIIDLTPTILHMFNIPVPDDIDGKVLKNIFRHNSEPARRKIKYQKVSGDEKEKIKSKIKELRKIRKI